MSKLICRTALSLVFEKFRDPDKRIQRMFPPRNSYQTEIRIAPTRFGLWLVRMTDVNDKSDPGTLLVMSPEKSARTPWVQTDPDRELHLFARVNVFSEKVPGEHPPELICNVYRPLNFSKESDRRIIEIQHYLAGQFSLEESFSRLQLQREIVPNDFQLSKDRRILHLEEEVTALAVA
ncbi:MAG: hypothetical protein AAB470_03175 [Patescibacteria group bacterium]